MVQPLFGAVLDACVLFPFTLRDTLLRTAEAGLYRPFWSEAILEEARRSLVEGGRASDAQARRLVRIMREAFPEAMVGDDLRLASSMPNNPDDRHVAAVAVRAGARTIVTSNLKHFRPLPTGILARSPDDFLMELFDGNRPRMEQLIVEQAAALKKPAVTADELLRALSKTVPAFARALTAPLRHRGP